MFKAVLLARYDKRDIFWSFGQPASGDLLMERFSVVVSVRDDVPLVIKIGRGKSDFRSKQRMSH